MTHLSVQLADAMIEGTETVALSDTDLIRLATSVAASDPKRRFTERSVRLALAKEHGVEWIKVEGESVLKRIEKMTVHNGPFISDRPSGYFKIAKNGTGKGVEFVKASRTSYSVRSNGEDIGELVVGEGEWIGATRQREKVWILNLDDHAFTGAKAPPDFRAVSDAKKWLEKAIA